MSDDGDPQKRRSIWRAAADVAILVAQTEGSPAGRLNLIGMLIAAGASGLAGITGWLEPVIRIVDKNYTSGIHFMPIFVVLLIFLLACVVVVGLLDRARG